MANGTSRSSSGWSDAYEVDFTAGGGGGDRPIVLSYSSSPPFTIPEGGTRPTTSALLDTCFRQVEYAGVLDGAGQPGGRRRRSSTSSSPRTFQKALPDNMYVFPVDDRRRAARRCGRGGPQPATRQPRSTVDRRSEIARAPRRVAARRGATCTVADVPPVRAERGTPALAGCRRAWCRSPCSCVFFVVPVVGMVGLGLLARRAASTSPGSADALLPPAGGTGRVVHALVRRRSATALTVVLGVPDGVRAAPAALPGPTRCCGRS